LVDAADPSVLPMTSSNDGDIVVPPLRDVNLSGMGAANAALMPRGPWIITTVRREKVNRQTKAEGETTGIDTVGPLGKGTTGKPRGYLGSILDSDPSHTFRPFPHHCSWNLSSHP
jgi:hypothetical protein